MRNSNSPQVIVIGGGPAGSTASTLIAQHGYKIQLFEREQFPRFHIGESLIPETYWVLKRLNMLPKMKASRFVKKYSVQFVSQKGKLSEPFYFMDHKPHECSQTWQVLRSEFDQMMLKNAEEHGVQVHHGVRVLDVLFDGDRAVGVEIQDENNTRGTVHADVIVDASGQASMIMSKLKLREWDPVLRKAALWTYFEGAFRDTGRDEGATLVLQTQGKNGWFWYIPLHNNIISVGIVAAFDYLFKGRGLSVAGAPDSASHHGLPTIPLSQQNFESIYQEELARCPAVRERVTIGKQADKFRAAREYSYRSRQVAGDGWVLVGDAFGFLDPLYSSGVLLALKSGSMAADAIVEGLNKGDTSAAQLGKWGPGFIQGMDRMRRLVVEYYDGFSFGQFVRRHPHFKGHLTDLLIGDLFKDDVDEVFPPMDAMRTEMNGAE
ncbi:MAG TPA: NAD(P)/FAD-dependent oxidoreductase [Gemmataceae bacterium]|jgi:flavin-dependent dehydrogenase|nr:NAD(P)/FAD-dependent oxidoreductase [Gemmataceae bacterium]